jgi:predicted dithiol-disulfide oxidoreductase (DUF899 family)
MTSGRIGDRRELAIVNNNEIRRESSCWGITKPSDTETVGISVFFKDPEGQIFHTYSRYQRGVDMLNGAHHYLDLVPKGRDEADQKQNTQAWVRRHDEYKD